MKIKKMKRQCCLAIPIFLFYLMLAAKDAHSQSNVRPKSVISGLVIDETLKPVPGTVISLLNHADSVLVKAAITDSLGKYLFEDIAFGNYIISSKMMGYSTMFSKSFQLTESRSQIAVEQFQLKMDSRSLKEISIVGQKNLIERKIDRLVMNVESSVLAEGNTVLELLEKAPSVSVDRDGNISMRGKPNVLIMLDGKATNVSSADVANILRNMQSNQVESIELITNPSARYDAAGTAGIINIKRKKNKAEGWNGVVQAGAGYGETSKYNGGTSLNYRNNRINFFGNYDYVNNGSKGTLDLNRIVNFMDTITRFNQSGGLDQRKKDNLYRVGLDYFVNKNHTIGVLMTGYSNRETITSKTNTLRENNFDQREDMNFLGNNKEKSWNTSFNLNYKGILDKKGKELSADVDYSHYYHNHDEIIDSKYTRINLLPRAPSSVMNFATSKIDVRSFKLDYSQPINKSSKLEAGLKSSFVSSDNNLLLARLQQSVWVPDVDYTNLFLYDENINAAYVNVNKAFKKTEIQVGLRGEQTVSKGNSVTNNQVVKRNYFDLFPSLAIAQSLGENHRLGFTYSRRIDRPNYGSLNPFLNFVDEYTFNKGNPYLKPQYSSSFELSDTYKGKITGAIYFLRTRDIMALVTEQDDATQKTVAIQRNIDSHQMVGMSLFIPFQLTKWWSMQNNIQAGYVMIKSELNGGHLNNTQKVASYFMNSSFIIDKSLQAESSLQYNTPAAFGIFKMRSQTVFNVGMKKTFNEKLQLSVNVNDVFNSRRDRVSTTYQNMNINFTQKSESQIARLTLTYRWGKSTVPESRQRSTGITEESNRLKN
ncbi:TonB-dependent receptor [Pedobacter steynii]|nr:outer membrane beta-barrel protein [Pedobacter steynii]NQX41018.1 TonB-dependent receptor [Pedobacter steynii]